MITVVAAKRSVFSFQPVKAFRKDIQSRIQFGLIPVDLPQGADCKPADNADCNAKNKLNKVDMFRKRLQCSCPPFQPIAGVKLVTAGRSTKPAGYMLK